MPKKTHGKVLRMESTHKIDGRKSSKPLFVMLEPDELERYKELAGKLGMTMRDLVRAGLERIWYTHRAQQVPSKPQRVASTDLPEASDEALASSRRLLEQSERIGRLEFRLDAVEDHLWGPGRKRQG